MKNVLILGVNGFIGHHLSEALLATGKYHVYGMDVNSDRLENVLEHPNFTLSEGDVMINDEWIEYHVKKCDVILPLVAIATPASYVKDPLRVFELDFESNLKVIRLCVKYKKRLIFPSTSEVYGMCKDESFHPYESNLVYGPIEKQRWIYACIKQLLDRVIYAHGVHDNFDYTLFRPFNWIGPGLDNLFSAKEGSSRVVTQFLGHLVRGENISLVDGGQQRRCFTDIRDGISALMKMIENENGIATRKIYNVGNPNNDFSVKDLAETMKSLALSRDSYKQQAEKTELVSLSNENYYGKGFQDVQHRVPWIDNTKEELKWAPEYTLKDSLKSILDFYESQAQQALQLNT
ncbi:MAG: bifunctional UDP-4-keto-pentose/UDP-xylose synthase [Bdellovibrionaceae bacterium]|nr:bifunctional UDP-4-keto-pentose/UDP-xylose synthase [Pseudobdellovibrionaceae bacterium]